MVAARAMVLVVMPALASGRIRAGSVSIPAAIGLAAIVTLAGVRMRVR